MWITDAEAGGVSCPFSTGFSLHGYLNGFTPSGSSNPSANLSGSNYRMQCVGAKCALWRKQAVMARPPQINSDGTYTAPEMRETGKGCCGLGFKPD